MRLAFIQDHPINESLPLTDLMAVCAEAGHYVEGFIEANEYRFLHSVRACRPELLVVPVDIGARPWAIDVIGRLRTFLPPGARVIGCGSDPTTNPGGIAGLGVDWAVTGEAEIPFLALLERIAAGEDARGLPGVWVRGDEGAPIAAGRPEDLDALPLPLRVLYLKQPRGPLVRNLRMNVTRGTLADGDERRKSPERFVEELRYLAKRRPLGSLHFTDEAFAEDDRWLGRFLETYERYARLPFTCKGPRGSIDKARMEALDAAGCRGFVLTIRAGDSLNQLSDLVERIHRIGWFFATTCVAGTTEEAERLLEWNRLLGARHARLRVAPGATDRALLAMVPWFPLLGRADRWGAWGGALHEMKRGSPARILALAAGIGERRLRGIPWHEAARWAAHAGLAARRTKGTAGYLP